jgi:hypothetical protein
MNTKFQVEKPFGKVNIEIVELESETKIRYQIDEQKEFNARYLDESKKALVFWATQEIKVDGKIQKVGGLFLPNFDEVKAAFDEIEKSRKEKVAAKKAQKIANIKSGEEKIETYYHDGEYLSGHTLHGEAAELLKELKLCDYVDGWGYHVESGLIKELGEKFTYQQAYEYYLANIKPALEAKAAKKAEKEAKEAAELKEAFDNELFVFGDEILSSVGNRLLHSLGAKISKQNNRIAIYTTGYAKMIPNANDTFKIKDILGGPGGMGFQWDGQEKVWAIGYSDVMAEKTIELLKKYDTKADPVALGLRRCWECGRWCRPSQLNEDGYCGC